LKRKGIRMVAMEGPCPVKKVRGPFRKRVGVAEPYFKTVKKSARKEEREEYVRKTALRRAWEMAIRLVVRSLDEQNDRGSQYAKEKKSVASGGEAVQVPKRRGATLDLKTNLLGDLWGGQVNWCEGGHLFE